MLIFNIILFISIWNMIMGIFLKPNQNMYCGMVGFSGETKFDVDKIRILLLANISRGMHATGIYNDGKVTKDAVNAIEFLAENKIIPENIFIGHDRHATVGGKWNAEFAHPFEDGDIIGQHNGTLTNTHHLETTYNINKTLFDVDSQVLVHMINKEKKDLSILQKFTGAAALLWIDKTKPTELHAFRNVERPLYGGYFNKGLYVSSIEESLKIIGCKKLFTFEENYHYVIGKGKIVSKVKKRETAVAPKKEIQTTIFDKTLGFDNLCHWVKCITSAKKKDGFIQDKWYFFNKVVNDDFLEVVNDEGENKLCFATYFSDVTNFETRTLVVVETADDKYFKKGEIVFLRGLEVNGDRTVASIEKMNDDNNVYTWGQNNLRTVDQKEAKYILLHNNINIINTAMVDILQDEEIEEMEKSKELTLLQEHHIFENDDTYFDENGNRLGAHWIEIGSLYESLIFIRKDIIDATNQLEEACANRHIAPSFDKEIIAVTELLSTAYDTIEEELECTFNKCYDYYKPTKKE